MGEERFLSVAAAARAKNLQLERLLDACRNNELPTREFGGDWYVPESILPTLEAWHRAREAQINSQYFLVNSLSRLLLIVSVIFVFQSFWRDDVWHYLRSGTQLTTEITGDTLMTALTAAPISRNAAAVVFADVTKELVRLWLAVLDFGQTLVSNLNYGWGRISTNWKQFLSRAPPVGSPDLTTTSPLDQLARAELKAEIKAELLRELSVTNQISGPMSKLPDTGLITLPASGDPAKDTGSLLELKNAFSDQVEVRFEASRQTGIITPIFRNGRGDDYLFVITPINKSTP
ncbi:MAG: hypothetical protein AAB677_00775 [Patescibacteria group bacterium]